MTFKSRFSEIWFDPVCLFIFGLCFIFKVCETFKKQSLQKPTWKGVLPINAIYTRGDDFLKIAPSSVLLCASLTSDEEWSGHDTGNSGYFLYDQYVG